MKKVNNLTHARGEASESSIHFKIKRSYSTNAIYAAKANKLTKALIIASLGLTLFGIGGCVLDNSSVQKEQPTKADTTTVKEPIKIVDTTYHLGEKVPFVFAVTSDYKTGNYSITGIDSSFSKNDFAAISGDPAVRYSGGNDIFILNRSRPNLQVIDRHNLKTVLQIPLEANANPQDLLVKDSLIYVAFLGLAKIGIFHEGDGSAAGSIDLIDYADTSDHLPETKALQFVGNDLYAILQNLDTKNGYIPLQAKLVKIDIKTKKVIQSLDLPYGNPASIAYDSSAHKFYIPCIGGNYATDFVTLIIDGGIIGVTLNDLAISDTVATEKSLGGGLNEAQFYNGDLYTSVSDSASTNEIEIVSIHVATGKKTEWARLPSFGLGGLGVDIPSKSLYVGDKAKGLRVFDLISQKEKSATNIGLGALPVNDLAIIR